MLSNPLVAALRDSDADKAAHAPSFITEVETLKLQQAAHGTSTRIERVWRALSDAVKARFIVDGQLRSLYV
jgi:hypothetical protein